MNDRGLLEDSSELPSSSSSDSDGTDAEGAEGAEGAWYGVPTGTIWNP